MRAALLLLTLGTLLVPPAARAQDYPSRPSRIVVPFAPAVWIVFDTT